MIGRQKIKLRGIVMVIGLGLVAMSIPIILYQPEGSTYHWGPLLVFVKNVSPIALVAGCLFITVFATHLRILGIVGCSLLLLGIGSTFIAGEVGGMSMGASGWIMAILTMYLIFPASVLLCAGTGIASLVKLIADESSARPSIYATAAIVTVTIILGLVMFTTSASKGPDVEPIIASLESTDDNVRSNAIVELGQIDDARVVEPLIEILENKDEDASLRAAAAFWLAGETKDVRAIGPLLKALKDKDERVRENAAFSLGAITSAVGIENNDRALQPLIDALQDENEAVRRAAAKSLGWMGDDRAIEPLIAALSDEDSLVQGHAYEALLQITDPPSDQRLSDDPAEWQEWLEEK